MQRLLTARKADHLIIVANSADLQILVEERYNMAGGVDAMGALFEEAARQTTLVGTKLIVPTVIHTNLLSNGSMVSSDSDLTIAGRNGTVQVRSAGVLSIIRGAGGIASGHLRITVRIPEGVRVTATTGSGNITAISSLADATLRTIAATSTSTTSREPPRSTPAVATSSSATAAACSTPRLPAVASKPESPAPPSSTP